MLAVSRRLLLQVAAALPALPRRGLAAEGPAARVALLHINDFYSFDGVDGRGGFPRLATAVKAERARYGADRTLLTHAGDAFSPSLMSGLDQGAHMVRLLTALGVDLMTFGNHEFDFGPDVARERAGEAGFAWLASNIVGRDGHPFAGAAETRIVTLGPVRLGFFSVTTPKTVQASRPGPDLAFRTWQETAAAEIPKLRAGGADLVVALTHQDFDQDLALLRHVDIVLGGHEHVLASYADGRRALIQAGKEAEYLGVLELEVRVEERDGRRRVRWEALPRFVPTEGLAADPAMEALTAGYRARLDRDLGASLGRLPQPWDTRRIAVRTRETAFGNLVADAIRAGTGAEAAFYNGGGIRGDRAYPAGSEIRRRDILQELPFANVAELLEVDGAMLRLAIEHGLGALPRSSGGFPQVSGLRVRFDPDAAAGGRVRALELAGAPVEAGRRYRLAVNDFTAGGGDGYTMLAHARRLIDRSAGRLVTGHVFDWIAAHGLASPVEGRLVAAG